MTKARTKWHKSTGKEVEVIDKSGKTWRCRILETRKCVNYHSWSLVDSYAETKPAKVAIAKAIMQAKVDRVTASRRCKCGATKSSASEMCMRCRYPNPGEKKHLTCECGNRMNVKSLRCMACIRKESRKDNGEFAEGTGEWYHGLTPLTSDEAKIVNCPRNTIEEQIADTILARKIREVRAVRDRLDAERGSPCEPVSWRNSAGGCTTMNTPGSDRRRGRA